MEHDKRGALAARQAQRRVVLCRSSFLAWGRYCRMPASHTCLPCEGWNTIIICHVMYQSEDSYLALQRARFERQLQILNELEY